MNIEDLSKTQLLLLTILVNFVTSIATGVLTVSLLDQAPPTVIQTVNRIVDHTIETVTTEVPVIGNAPAPVPSSEELLTAAIAEDAARSVKIFRAGVADPIALGIFLPSTRAVVTYGSNFPGTVSIVFADGTSMEAHEAGMDGELRRYTFDAGVALPQAPNTRLIPLAELKQGQTVIAIGEDGTAITGIIARTDELLHTDLPPLSQGAAAVNLSGDVIGISVGDGRFIPADRISTLSVQP